MSMIPIQNITGKHLLNARTSKTPVVVIDALTFRIPPATHGEREHKVQLDDQERPAACSCTCGKGLMGKPCWAMARVLAVLNVLSVNNIYVNRRAESSWQALLAAASAVEKTASARVAAGGDMTLIWGSHPEAETIYVVP